MYANEQSNLTGKTNDPHFKTLAPGTRGANKYAQTFSFARK